MNQHWETGNSCHCWHHSPFLCQHRSTGCTSFSEKEKEKLCQEIAPYLQSMHKFERVAIEKKMLITIWELANQDVYWEIGNLFDTSRGGAQRCIMEVCSAVTDNLFDTSRAGSQRCITEVCIAIVEHLKPLYDGTFVLQKPTMTGPILTMVWITKHIYTKVQGC